MWETVRTEGNREYYYNADNKLVFRTADDTIGYRESELCPTVKQLLDRARDKYNYPTRPFIDSVIEFQNENKIKAINYVKYKLLGECNYLDVFGPNIQAQIAQEDTEERLQRLENKIEQLLKLVENLTEKGA